MNLNTVLGRMAGWYESGMCFYLISPPGRGKTTTIARAPEVLGKDTGKNIGIVIINGGLLTPMHVLGFGLPKHHDGYSEMIFSQPFFWRTSEGKRLEEYDGGIIFVDEADKMDADVKKCVGEAALSGNFGPHKLPPGWVVWMAGNTAAHRSGSTKELDHLINRRDQIEITDDIVSWDDWALTNGVTPVFRHFANENPDKVFTDAVPDKQGPWCTPRSGVKIDAYHQILARRNNGVMPMDSATIEETAGAIGSATASQLFATYRLERDTPKFELVVANPMTVKVPDKPDAAMMMVFKLAHRVESKNLSPVIQYIDRLPKEFALSFCKSVTKRVPALAIDPAMKAWSSTNATLLASLA